MQTKIQVVSQAEFENWVRVMGGAKTS